MKAKPAVSNSDALAPAGSTASVIQELGKHMRKARIALVGHEPNMGELAARLIGAAPAARVQEGGDLPDRLRSLPAEGDRAAQLVASAQDAAEASLSLVNSATSQLRNSQTPLHARYAHFSAVRVHPCLRKASEASVQHRLGVAELRRCDVDARSVPSARELSPDRPPHLPRRDRIEVRLVTHRLADPTVERGEPLSRRARPATSATSIACWSSCARVATMSSSVPGPIWIRR